MEPRAANSPGKDGPVGVSVAVKTVRPRLAVHADAWTVAAAVAKALIEFRRAGLGIEVHDEEPVIGTVLIRVEHDPRARGIGRDPVRLLADIEGDAAYFARFLGVGNIQHS